MAKITKQRKVTYYIGIGMTVLGFILFISVFFSAAMFMNNPFGASREPSFMNSDIIVMSALLYRINKNFHLIGIFSVTVV